MKSTNSTVKLPTETVAKLKKQKTSDTCFIIGGGPSLKTILPDTSVLKGRDIICTNNAYKLYPDALVLHFMDRVWWTWHQEPEHNVQEVFKGEIISCSTTSHHHNLDKHRVTYFKRIVDKAGKIQGGLAEDGVSLRGNNSGHQAINLAYILGYKQAVLIGFDLDKQAKNSNWHKDHRRVTNREMFDHNMLPQFEMTAEWLKDKPMNVYNLNHNSAIRGFTFANLDDLIDIPQ